MTKLRTVYHDKKEWVLKTAYKALKAKLQAVLKRERELADKYLAQVTQENDDK